MLEYSEIKTDYQNFRIKNVAQKITFPVIEIPEYKGLIDELQKVEDTNTLDVIFWLIKRSPKIIYIIYKFIKLLEALHVK